MVKRISDNFIKGIGQIRWFSSVFSERVKIEVAVVKLLFRSDEMEKKRELLLRTIGERVCEFRGQQDKNLLRDRVITEAMSEIERIEKDMDELKHKVSEISSIKA
ncbi:MAG: hypothetical protein M0Z79_09095 [Nitrospiraceae bacterium]|nr:hypothetical protein [Nitrospiraceae bacterium]